MRGISTKRHLREVDNLGVGEMQTKKNEYLRKMLKEDIPYGER